MQVFNSCKCQAVRELQTGGGRGEQIKVTTCLEGPIQDWLCFRELGGGESRMATKQRKFCFLFITPFMGFFPPRPLPPMKEHFFIRNFSMPSLGNSSIFLHPSNPLPPSAHISHLWENPKALHSLPLFSWLKVSSGNITESCSAPEGQSLSAALLCCSTPKAVMSQAFISQPGWALCTVSPGDSLTYSGN